MSKKNKTFEQIELEGEIVSDDNNESNVEIEKPKKKQLLSDEAKKSSCNLSAFGLVYDKQQKIYELVTIKYSYDKQYAIFEKTEPVGDSQVMALNKLNQKVDLLKVRAQGKGEEE